MLRGCSKNLHAEERRSLFLQHGGSCPLCEACPPSAGASSSEEGGHGAGRPQSHLCSSLELGSGQGKPRKGRSADQMEKSYKARCARHNALQSSAPHGWLLKPPMEGRQEKRKVPCRWGYVRNGRGSLRGCWLSWGLALISPQPHLRGEEREAVLMQPASCPPPLGDNEICIQLKGSEEAGLSKLSIEKHNLAL